jgi:hypothetical protein
VWLLLLRLLRNFWLLGPRSALPNRVCRLGCRSRLAAAAAAIMRQSYAHVLLVAALLLVVLLMVLLVKLRLPTRATARVKRARRLACCHCAACAARCGRRIPKGCCCT